MSRYIATRAIRGANLIAQEAEALLNKALAENGPETAGGFPEHRLLPARHPGHDRPRGHQAGRAGAGAGARQGPAAPDPDDAVLDALPGRDAGLAAWRRCWRPRSSRRCASSTARSRSRCPASTWPAAQLHQPRRSRAANGNGHLNGPIDDIQLRAWGIQLVDGRMPGFAAIVGCAKSNEVAVKIVRELQQRNILIFLSRQRQRPLDHPPAAGRRRRDGLRHLHRALRPRHHLGHLRRWASPPARR